MGHNLARGKRAIELPAPLTYSVLPHTSYSQQLARLAHDKGKQVMLHLPMSNVQEYPLGPGALTAKLKKPEFLKVLIAAINDIPNLSGINNHMGSSLTQEPVQMSWLMKEIKNQGLFFVDSRTTKYSIASNIAQLHRVKSSSRDIFLDNVQDTAAIDIEFKKLIAVAHRNGSAIAIGHPHAVTLDYLEKAIPVLAVERIQIVQVSELVRVYSSRFARVSAIASAKSSVPSYIARPVMTPTIPPSTLSSSLSRASISRMSVTPPEAITGTERPSAKSLVD
jgi:polysaccharide deacetylase 2 family uncharacterized protein YibQ